MNVPLTPVRFKRRAATHYAKKVGIVCGEERFTYGQFDRRANKLSNALLKLGIKKGDVVAFLSYNCHRLLEAYYGVVQIGAVLLSLNIRLSPGELTYILNDSEARLLFFDKDFLPIVNQMRGDLNTVSRCLLLTGADEVTYEDLLAEASSEEPPDPGIDEDDLAELFYTSGTTANPKGVMLTHRNLYLHALNAIAALAPKDTHVQLHTIPLFHVNGWGTPHTVTCAGGTHVMIKKFDPQLVLELIERERVTHFSMVPTMATALINHPDIGKRDLSTVEFISVGGAASPVELIKEIEKKIGCKCYVGYGLTETSPVLTLAFVKSYLADQGEEERYKRQAMTGYSIPGVELRVVDDQDRDVPKDGVTIGEIIVRSDSVMKGYWKLPEETDRVIRNGWFHTGDLATIDEDNYILIVDRKKDIIISGGENITSIEIEKAIYSHPAVYECAVIAVPDEKWGEVPKALVVLKPGESVTEQEIIDHCRARIAAFKVPKSVEFLDSLPKGGTGKILKKELREKYWKGYAKRVH